MQFSYRLVSVLFLGFSLSF